MPRILFLRLNNPLKMKNSVNKAKWLQSTMENKQPVLLNLESHRKHFTRILELNISSNSLLELIKNFVQI